jgi:hypothetical protein
MGNLNFDKIDMNDRAVIEKIKRVIDKITSNANFYNAICYKEQYYFEISLGQITTSRGWYILLNEKMPLYVGQADNLNFRLNNNNGSTDNFANKIKRNVKRNFIKKFDELGLFSSFRVCIITEDEFCKEMGVSISPCLSKIDIDNIEKFLDIFRDHFTYH